MKPRSWRPLLRFVQDGEPMRREILEAKFPRELVHTAGNVGLIEIRGDWVVFTDYGSEVLRACDAKLRRQRRAEEAVALLEEARKLLLQLDKHGHNREFTGTLTKFLSDVRG